MTPALQFLLASVIVAVASALQAATGMGMALLAAPSLALVDPRLVPGPVLLSVMVLSAVVAWRERAMLDIRLLAPAILGLLAGTAIATALLVLLFDWHFAGIFAALILLAVLLSLLGLPIRVSRLALLIGGTASGVLGTMTGVHGPPIALVMQHEAPGRLRGMLCAIMAIGCAIALTALTGIGAFGVSRARLGLTLLPGVAAGLALAPIAARRIDQRRARIAVLSISALSALALLFH
jgi:uncharacterized protein